MRLVSIHVYPVKSLGGRDLTEAVVEPWGLRGDRRWLVLNPDGTYLTARSEPLMLSITATTRPDGGITLQDGGERLMVDVPLDGEVVPTAVPRLESVRLAAPEAHQWLSARLDRELRLAWLDDPTRRSVAADHCGHEGDSLNLSDAGPLLLCTVPSMNQLNDRILAAALERGEDLDPLPISRFRPTIVVDGDFEPFAEDHWPTVTIGGVRFRFAEFCDRCVLTTIDTRTYKTTKEPIRTLARFRQWDHKTFFGVRLVPVTTGTIRVGDAVSA
jgi:MOSC domain-containing protein